MTKCVCVCVRVCVFVASFYSFVCVLFVWLGSVVWLVGWLVGWCCVLFVCLSVCLFPTRRKHKGQHMGEMCFMSLGDAETCLGQKQALQVKVIFFVELVTHVVEHMVSFFSMKPILHDQHFLIFRNFT